MAFNGRAHFSNAASLIAIVDGCSGAMRDTAVIQHVRDVKSPHTGDAGVLNRGSCSEIGF